MPQMTGDEYRDFLMEGTRTAKLATTRRGGIPHVVPVWFVMDGEDLIFTTGRDTVKGRALRRDGRVALCVDYEEPPYAFVLIEGVAEITEEADDLLDWTTRLAARYVGEEKAEEYGRRNALPEELLVRVIPAKVVAQKDMTGE